MITVEDACVEVMNKYPEKKFSLEYLVSMLNTMGGAHFICTDELWECYGKKKFYNKVLDINDKTKKQKISAIENYFS
tara:strand:+ start:7606 stop:7836 length:231 start_codon:yes stop_codon:yes gene_type:complete